MSTYDNEDSPSLIIAIKLVRLRDRVLGFEKAEQLIDPLLREILDMSAQVIGRPDTTSKSSRFIIASMIHAISRYADEVFPYQIDELRKFISALNLLHLNTDDENNQLRTFETRIERIMHPMRNLEMTFQNTLNNITNSMIGDLQLSMNELVNVHEEFAVLRNSIDRRTLDVLSTVSQTIDPIKAEQLFRLFTQEP